MPVVRLTAKERILIHLADFAKYAEVVEVPPEMGQEGIAQAAGLHIQHVRQFIDPLLKAGLLRERIAHVRGHRRRLKVCDLTDAGRLAATRLREQVRGETIRVRDAQGVREMTVGELLREALGKIALTSVMQAATDGHVVDLASLGPKPATPFLARLAEAPRLEAFVGRHEELEALTRDGDGPRVFAVRGVAGIGKSSLAARACEQLKASRNVYWHQIRPWDTRPSILAGFADFLAAIGRPGLRAVLDRGETDKADQVIREDLPGSRCVLVFDDTHQAISEVIDLLRFLKEALAGSVDGRAIVLSRRALPFYDRRDVSIRHLVHEIDLQGLDRDEIAELLPSDPERSRLIAIAGKLGGHPLFLELLRTATTRSLGDRSLTDVRRFIEEEIYSDLSDAERRMMKTAALYEVPFPREALFVDTSLSHDVLLSLTTKSLIRPVGDDAFGVHDTIRDFFASILTPTERENLAPVVVRHLVHASETAKASKDFVASLNCMSNALELAGSPEEHAVLSESLGDTYERLGDLPAALAAYSEALRYVAEPDSTARLHRKTASALQVRGETAPAAAAIETAFRALGDQPSVERGWLHLLQCRVAAGREDWAEAMEHGEAALASFKGSEDAGGQAETLLELGRTELYSPRGDPAQAERYLLAALDLPPSVEESDFQGRVHVALANLYAYRMGDIARASRHIEVFRGLESSITDPHVLRTILMHRGWFALYLLADFEQADRFFREAVDLARKIHDRRTVAFAKYGLAQSLFFRGETEAAREGFREFAIDVREVGVAGDEVDALWSIAECSLILEDIDGFRTVVAELRDPRLADGLVARPLHARVVEALNRLFRGDREGCSGLFEDAVRVAETSYLAGEAVSTGFVRFYYGAALRGMGDETGGTEQIRRARTFLERSGLHAQLEAAARDEPRLVALMRRLSLNSEANDA